MRGGLAGSETAQVCPSAKGYIKEAAGRRTHLRWSGRGGEERSLGRCARLPPPP